MGPRRDHFVVTELVFYVDAIRVAAYCGAREGFVVVKGG